MRNIQPINLDDVYRIHHPRMFPCLLTIGVVNSGRFFSNKNLGRFVVKCHCFHARFWGCGECLVDPMSLVLFFLVLLLVERGDDQNFRMLRRKPHLTLCDKYVIFAVVFQAPMVFVLSDSKRDFPGRWDRGESHISLWLDDRWVSV